MTEKIQKQRDLGVALGSRSGEDALQVALSKNHTFATEMPLGCSFRVTQGNHSFESVEGETTTFKGLPRLDTQALKPFIGSGHPGFSGPPVEVRASHLQPPVVGAILRDAVNRLALEATTRAAKQPLTPASPNSIEDTYVKQIMTWSQRLTPMQLGRKYSLEEVMALAGLKGRYRELPSARYTGEALRRCGFVPKRDWTSAGRNKRYWTKGV